MLTLAHVQTSLCSWHLCVACWPWHWCRCHWCHIYEQLVTDPCTPTLAAWVRQLWYWGKYTLVSYPYVVSEHYSLWAHPLHKKLQWCSTAQTVRSQMCPWILLLLWDGLACMLLWDWSVWLALLCRQGWTSCTCRTAMAGPSYCWHCWSRQRCFPSLENRWAPEQTDTMTGLFNQSINLLFGSLGVRGVYRQHLWFFGSAENEWNKSINAVLGQSKNQVL